MLSEFPSPHDPHVRHLRHLFLAVVTGSFLFLIPWIGYLSVTLPDHHEVSQWRFAWVGFDGALIAALGVTALCAWRRLQIFIPWAVITATLLCCDAWFDIVLDWNGGGLSAAVVSAVCAEFPLAALLVYAARKMIRLTVIIAWHRSGRLEPVPTLSRMTLVKLAAEEDSERDRPCPLPAEGPRRGAGHPRPARPGPHGRPGGVQPYKHDRDHRQGDQARGGHRDPGPGHHHDGERR